MITEVFYWCDPSKATGCKKTCCFIYGGQCALTTCPSHAYKPVTTDQCSSSWLTEAYREKFRKKYEDRMNSTV